MHLTQIHILHSLLFSLSMNYTFDCALYNSETNTYSGPQTLFFQITQFLSLFSTDYFSASKLSKGISNANLQYVHVLKSNIV